MGKKMCAKIYLMQLQTINEMINQNIERLEEMKIQATCIRGVDYSKERVQTSMNGDTICNSVTKYVALDEETERFIDAKNQIINEIRGLRNMNYVKILFKVYAQHKTLKVASEEMRISYSYAVELHKKSLAVFEKTYKNLHYLT